MANLEKLLRDLLEDEDDNENKPRKKRSHDSSRDEGDDDDDDNEEGLSLSQQKAALEDFITKKPTLKVGQYVKRNELGKHRYTQPRKDMVAIVTDVFPAPIYGSELDKGGTVLHGAIGIAVKNKGKVTVVNHAVDFRFYEYVSSAPKISED